MRSIQILKVVICTSSTTSPQCLSSNPKPPKGHCVGRYSRQKQVMDKLGLQCVFASASKRGRPAKKGARTTYTMNMIKSSAHNAVICHLLSQQASPLKCPPVPIQKQHLLSKTVETPALHKRQKMAEGIDWLLRAATELEVDYVEMFYCYRQGKFPRLVDTHVDSALTPIKRVH